MEELLKEMDVDGSGDVDFSEFIHILKQRTAISSEEEDLWVSISLASIFEPRSVPS